MFNPIRRKLTIIYTLSFFVFLLTTMTAIYVLMSNTMQRQQIAELETYYTREQHDLAEHMEGDGKDAIEYNSNRSYFYYVFKNDREIVEGDEQFKGFYTSLIKNLPEDLSKSALLSVEWHEEHLLLLLKPIFFNGEQQGLMVVGQSVTDQYHFLQNMLWTFMAMTILLTFLSSIISYYFAGRAMKPIEESFEKQKRFVSNASHELRTPLSIFYSSLELLESEEKGKLSPLSQEVLIDLKLEASKMKELLENLLFLARNDQKKVKLKKEDFSLSILMESAGNKFSSIIPPAIQFEMNLDKDIQIYGEKPRMEELIYILLDNAVQYSEEGWINLSLKRVGGNAVIKIQDTGVGISEADMDRIFDRFYRGDEARVRSGTGLGLSIAKSIVDSHKGTIQVESKKGLGSTFTIRLPIRKIDV